MAADEPIEEELAPQEVKALLKEIEVTEHALNEMESRVDQFLARLDQMLEEQSDTASSAESESGKEAKTVI